MSNISDFPRTAWEQPNYTVAEHTTSGPVDRNALTNVVIHYPGSDNINSNTAAELQSTQKYYATVRGYSIGYNYIVDEEGVAWEARGLDFKSAATKGFNNQSVAIQLKVAGQSPANPAQIERTQRLIDDLQSWAGKTLAITGHRDHRPTQCPGTGIYPQVLSGAFVPHQISLNPSEDLEMRIIAPPVRVYDSRKQNSPLQAQVAREINIGHQASSAFVNITTVSQSEPGFLTAWGEGSMPDVSNLNYGTEPICNTSWVPVVNGKIQLWAYTQTHVIVDIQAVAD